MISIVIVAAKQKIGTLKYLVSCPSNYETIIVREQGIGLARSIGASRCHGELMLQLDDDIEVNPKLWSFIFSLKKGEFTMAHVGEHVSTRVFAIYIDDYRSVGGFNEEIKYIFEDGDFYHRATTHGLKFRVVPSNLYKHIPHPYRNQNRIVKLKMNWEYCHMFVLQPRYVFRNPLKFFRNNISKKNPLDIIPIIFGVIYWLLKE